jgi:hypothetical protein
MNDCQPKYKWHRTELEDDPSRDAFWTGAHDELLIGAQKGKPPIYANE